MVTVACSIVSVRVRVRCVVRASCAHARTIPRAFSVTKRAPIAFVKMAGNVEFLAGIRVYMRIWLYGATLRFRSLVTKYCELCQIQSCEIWEFFYAFVLSATGEGSPLLEMHV